MQSRKVNTPTQQLETNQPVDSIIYNSFPTSSTSNNNCNNIVEKENIFGQKRHLAYLNREQNKIIDNIIINHYKTKILESLKENKIDVEPNSNSSKHPKWRKKVITNLQVLVMEEW